MSIDSVLEKQNLYKLHLWRAPAVCLPYIIHGSGHFRSCWYLVLYDWSAGGSNINTSILNMHQYSPHMRVLCLWWIDDCVCGQTAEVLCQASRGQSSCSCIQTQAQLTHTKHHEIMWLHEWDLVGKRLNLRKLMSGSYGISMQNTERNKNMYVVCLHCDIVFIWFLGPRSCF